MVEETAYLQILHLLDAVHIPPTASIVVNYHPIPIMMTCTVAREYLLFADISFFFHDISFLIDPFFSYGTGKLASPKHVCFKECTPTSSPVGTKTQSTLFRLN